MEAFTIPQGTFFLNCFPPRPQAVLRAWDAADEYLLHELNLHHAAFINTANILILNDRFGALTVALSEFPVQMASDSCLSHQSTLLNLRANNRPTTNIHLLTSLQNPVGPLDLVLIKIPKSHAFLEDQLFRIRPYLTPQSKVIGAGMVRSIHSSTLKLFERLIGPTRTSLAKKKARLIYAQPDLSIRPGDTPYPSMYQLQNPPLILHNHANVFSRTKVDIGTRFFLQHVPSSSGPQQIIDLGCGNGVIGLVAAHANPQAQLSFIDESFMAIDSAQINFKSLFRTQRQAFFKINNGLDTIPSISADWVLCNPPAHHLNAHDTTTAIAMFKKAKLILKTGGSLWIIANHKLGYQTQLKRLFGHIKCIASNRKFVVIQATKT